MIEYWVKLKRHAGQSEPDVCIFRDRDRETAIREMRSYCRKYGFTVEDSNGWHTVADIILVEQESVAGAPVLGVKSYHEIFDVYDERRKENEAR